jgi:hypothetical protein
LHSAFVVELAAAAAGMALPIKSGTRKAKNRAVRANRNI